MASREQSPADESVEFRVRVASRDVDGIGPEAFADIGPAVARLGVPVAEILDEYEALRAAVSEIAERFRIVFERRLWEPFVGRGMPADEIPSLTSDVNQLTELATSVVTTELHDRFAAFAADYLTRAEESGARG